MIWCDLYYRFDGMLSYVSSMYDQCPTLPTLLWSELYEGPSYHTGTYL